jgi:hypothetical protein
MQLYLFAMELILISFIMNLLLLLLILCLLHFAIDYIIPKIAIGFLILEFDLIGLQFGSKAEILFIVEIKFIVG